MNVIGTLGGAGVILFVAASAYRKSRAGQKQSAPKAAQSAQPRPRTIVPGEHGLPSRDQLFVLGTQVSPQEEAALEAARGGDWRPAAALLSQRGSDWDLAWSRLGPFDKLAAQDDRWLQAWRKAEPENPDAALLHAGALVTLAWQIRSSKLASEVTREQFEGFHRVLAEAEQAAYEAARLAPAADPNPYVVLLAVAMGLAWPHERQRAVWAEIVARAPQHYRAHDRALQYWCQKWYGSHELMHSFIDGAIAAAPAGSLLTSLKVAAFREQFQRDNAPDSAWNTPQVHAALDAALADVAAADPAHLRMPDARSWLAYGLSKVGRHAEAVDQFRALGRVVAGPWVYFNDPIDGFVGNRASAVLGMLDSVSASR